MRNRDKYGKDWKKKTTEAKEAAGWQCEKCGVVHKTPRWSKWTEREWPVYLQSAHKNHDPENPDAELVVVCPSCHWRHYRKPGQRPAWMIEAQKHRALLRERGASE